MGEFVRQRKHLCRLAVRAIDKDQGGQLVGQRKAAKFFHAQRPVGIASHNAARHNQHACVFDLRDKLAQGIFPARQLLELCQDKPQDVAHGFCHSHRLPCYGGAAYEVQLCKSVYTGIVAIPILPLLTEVQRIQQVRAWAQGSMVGHGTKIGDGQCFLHGGR